MPARMGYLKLTRAGLESVWFQRATVAGKAAANGAKLHTFFPKTAERLWNDINWNSEGMVTTSPGNAQTFLRWAKTIDGWRDTYAVFEPTGESRI